MTSRAAALAGARAELAHVQKNLPHKGWHLAGPALTLTSFLATSDPIDVIILPIGMFASLFCSASIMDRYDEERRLLVKCAQLAAEKD